MSKIISIHSFRGGTGKSNIAANLATILAAKGNRVGLVDTDIQSPGIHAIFGLEVDETKYSLNDYLWGKCDVSDAAYDVTPNLETDIGGKVYLVPSSINSGEIARVLREGYDEKKGSVGFITTGEVYEIYKDLCKKTRYESLTQRRVADLISELDMLGIITARVISKGRYGRTREIKLSTDSDEIMSILKDDDVYVDLSNYKLNAQTRLI